MNFLIDKYMPSLSDQQKRNFLIFLSIASVFLVGFIDYTTGYEISLFIFYAFPIALGAWFIGRNFGLFLSVLAIAVWFYADIKSGHRYSEDWILHWNGGVRLAFFIIDAYVLSALKKRLDFEKEWARVDGLTGALNGRGFRDRLDTLFPFAARTKSPFALAFIDLDNFKRINDTKGHEMGDLILQRSVNTMKKNLRGTDFIGRMGGDEFAIFLPATDAKGAKSVLETLRQKLLLQVGAEGWGIGYSIGAVTFDPNQSDTPHYTEVINRADKLMYTIKHGGKNDIVIAEF